MRQLYDTRSSAIPSAMGKRVLIVEDEYLIAVGLAHEFRSVGAQVIGPVPSLEEGFLAIEGVHLEGAVLDIDLDGEMVFPLAEKLRDQGVSFVFFTGYDRWSIPTRYRSIPLCGKPMDCEQIAKALFG